MNANLIRSLIHFVNTTPIELFDSISSKMYYECIDKTSFLEDYSKLFKSVDKLIKNKQSRLIIQAVDKFFSYSLLVYCNNIFNIDEIRVMKHFTHLMIDIKSTDFDVVDILLLTKNLIYRDDEICWIIAFYKSNYKLYNSIEEFKQNYKTVSNYTVYYTDINFNREMLKHILDNSSFNSIIRIFKPLKYTIEIVVDV